MENDELQSELFYLIAFLLTSARGLYAEPPDYGPFRLVDASGRLLEILEAASLLDPFLDRLKTEIDALREGEMDDTRQRRELDRWVVEIAAELKKRTTGQ